MSKKIACCLLAYGEEHIDECNYLIKQLSKYKNTLNFYVSSDKSEKIEIATKIISINESFNYNLKRISVGEAIKEESDVILIMDSDFLVKNNNINFIELNNIKDGIYVMLDTNFKKRNIDLEKITTGDCRNDNDAEYLRTLYKIYGKNEGLFLIYEYIILLKLTDKDKKENFIKNWNFLYEETKGIQPKYSKKMNDGASEGLIIYLSCLMSDINIFEIEDNKFVYDFFQNFYHYCDEEYKPRFYRKKSLI